MNDLPDDSLFETPPYVFIESFDRWMAPDGKGFRTEGEVRVHIHADEIDAQVKAFMAHIDAHAEDVFKVPAKRGCSTRYGGYSPAHGEKPMLPRAKAAARTKLERAARRVYEFEASRIGD